MYVLLTGRATAHDEFRPANDHVGKQPKARTRRVPPNLTNAKSEIEAAAGDPLKKLRGRRPRRGRPARGRPAEAAAIALLERCAPESLVAVFRLLLLGAKSSSGSSRSFGLTQEQRRAVALEVRSVIANGRRLSTPKLARTARVNVRTLRRWRRLPGYEREVVARVSLDLAKQLSNKDHPIEAASADQVSPQRKLRSEATKRWPDHPFIRLLPDVGPKSELSPVELAQYLLDHSVVIRSPEQCAQHMFERGLQFAPDYGPALREIEALRKPEAPSVKEDAVNQKGK